MIKRFGQYLPALVLVLTALALLCSTAANRTGPVVTDPPATTAQPATNPAAAETLPADALPRVQELLSGYQLAETAAAVCVYDETLHADVPGKGPSAMGHALARLCGQRQMNPISAFWMLEEEGVYSYTPDVDSRLGAAAFDVPRRMRRVYPFNETGTRRLLSDILKLARSMDDGMDLEQAFLSWDGKINSEWIYHAEGDCHYAYFVYYGDSAAHFLCFYVRGEERINHVELQMLNLCYKEGTPGPGDGRGETQAALLMAATEKLLTGTSRVNEGNIPLVYPLEGGEVIIERYDITGPGEIGSLTNYSLRLTE